MTPLASTYCLTSILNHQFYMIGYGGHCIDKFAPPSFTTPRLAMTWTRHPLTFMLSTPTYLTAEYDPRVDCSSPTSCHHYVIIGRHAPLPFCGSRLYRAHESRLVFDARPGGHITDRIVAVLPSVSPYRCSTRAYCAVACCAYSTSSSTCGCSITCGCAYPLLSILPRSDFAAPLQVLPNL